MSKPWKKQAKRPNISQPLNFRQTESANDILNPHHNSGRPQFPQSSQSIPPAPCPGTSIVQNIGTLSLNQNEINSIVSQVTEAVKQELQPLLQCIQQFESGIQYRCISSQIIYERKNNQTSNATEDSCGYVNYEDTDPSVVKQNSPTCKSEEDVPQAVFNPMYTTGHTITPSPCQSVKRNKPPVAVPRSKRSSCLRERPGRKCTPNMRDCYSKAIQKHINDILDSIIFTGSQLPDDLISEQCLTETECSTIREKSDLRDQLRNLVVIIKTRDLRVLMKFLGCLEKQSGQLVEIIKQTAEAYNKDGYKERKCLMCRIKCNINIKNVADQLWGNDLIEDEIYIEIINCDRPVGTQDFVWEKLLETLAQNGSSRQALETIEHFLKQKDHYNYLADEIHKALSKTCERFECACKIHVRFSDALSSAASSTCSPQASSGSSCLPSSEEILSTGCNHNPSMNCTCIKEEISATLECDEQVDEQQDEVDQQQGKEEKERVKAIPECTTPVKNEEYGAIRIVNSCTDQLPPPLPKKKQTSTDSSDPRSTYV